MNDVEKSALAVNEMFQTAIEFAEAESGGENLADIKWAMVAVINTLRDKGLSDDDSLKVAQECLTEVSGFIADFDKQPTHLRLVN